MHFRHHLSLLTGTTTSSSFGVLPHCPCHPNWSLKFFQILTTTKLCLESSSVSSCLPSLLHHSKDAFTIIRLVFQWHHEPFKITSSPLYFLPNSFLSFLLKYIIPKKLLSFSRYNRFLHIFTPAYSDAFSWDSLTSTLGQLLPISWDPAYITSFAHLFIPPNWPCSSFLRVIVSVSIHCDKIEDQKKSERNYFSLQFHSTVHYQKSQGSNSNRTGTWSRNCDREIMEVCYILAPPYHAQTTFVEGRSINHYFKLEKNCICR